MRILSRHRVAGLFYLSIVAAGAAASAKPADECPKRFHVDVIAFVEDVDSARHMRVDSLPDSIADFRLCEISVPGHPILEGGGFFIHHRTGDLTYFLSTSGQFNPLVFGPLKFMQELPAADSDEWTIAEGFRNEKPSILRFRPRLADFLGDDRYPRVLEIVWEYGETNSSGMPTQEQTDQMRKLEDGLDDVLDSDRLAILAFVRTEAGTRSWTYYVSDMTEAGNRINEFLEPGLPISLTARDDADWQELKSVIDMCRE